LRFSKNKNPPKSPFKKGGLFGDNPFEKEGHNIPPLLKKRDTIFPPLEKGGHNIPPFLKGGLGGILRSKDFIAKSFC